MVRLKRTNKQWSDEKEQDKGQMKRNKQTMAR